jgi:hypothetical protein
MSTDGFPRRTPGDAPPPAELSSLLHDIARHLQITEDLEESLQRLVQVAIEMISGCDLASVTLVDDERLVTAAATEPVARRLDDLQLQEGEGPCLDAAGPDQWIHTTTLNDDDRWPAFSQRVTEEFGLGSLLACQLARVDRPEQRTGAVNLYSRRPDAFTEADGMIGLLIGAHAGVLVDAAQKQADLRQAVRSRDVIGQAKGILMAHRGISEQEAFDQLVEVSQRFNIKLRELARLVSDSTARGEMLSEPPSDP